jgi:hypothetical protein
MIFLCVSVKSYAQVTKQVVLSEEISKKLKKKIHLQYTDSLSFKNQLRELKLLAYKNGYISFSIDSIHELDSTTLKAFIFLGEKYQNIQVNLSLESRKSLRKIGYSPKNLTLITTNPRELSANLKNVLKQFEQSGYPFAELSFSNLSVSGKQLKIDIDVHPNQRMKWKEIIIKGEKAKISTRYMESFLHIKKGDWYNQTQVDLIKTRISQVTFIRETKPSELLFTDEGATLYLYLETKPVSLFNGTVGLQQDPVKLKYQLTGELRLKLQNILKHGELLDLSWRSIQPKSPQLNLQLNYPFLFNTPFGINGQFSLFKKDTTYLELKTRAGVLYTFSGNKTLQFFYKNHQSNTLGNISTSQYGTSKSNSYGVSFSTQTVDYLPSPKKGFILHVEGNIGKRKLTKDSTNYSYLIYGGKLQFDYFQSIGKRIVIKSSILTETFYTNNIQTNELIRFGGNLSQRGFMEDELLSTFRSTISIEPRFILDQNSFLFIFYDQSWYERNVQNYINDAPRGFGAGISFGTKIGIFSLSYALGKQFNNPILFRDSKVHFGYVAYF